MRVALIGPVPPELGGATSGGVATHQMHLAAGLKRAGIEAPLLATNTWATAAAAFEGRAPFPLVRMPRPDWRDRAYWTAVGLGAVLGYGARIGLSRQRGSRREVLEQALAYRAFVKGNRPDVIHVQHPLERATYVRLVQRQERWRIPTIITAHSLFGEHAEATIYGLMAPNLRAADRVIAVSEHIAQQAAELGVDPKRVRVIRSGVDTERFRPRDKAVARERLQLPSDAAVVLFVGNLEPRKQVHVLLRAVAGVARDVAGLRLLVVGSGESAGDEDQTTYLKRRTDELQLDAVVRFLGRVDPKVLEDCYAAADVFALPSSSEAQGIVALEAMACGLAVVASSVGGLLGTIEDGVSGFLVPAGDHETLAARLRSILIDAPLRQRIGGCAREAVEREFTWERAVGATIDAYREVACP